MTNVDSQTTADFWDAYMTAAEADNQVPCRRRLHGSRASVTTITANRRKPPRQLRPLCAPREPRRAALRCQRKIDVPSAPTPKPATAMGRHSCSPGTVKARITAINQQRR